MKIILGFLLFLFPLCAFGAVDFDGSDGVISCGSAASLDDEEPFTISMWINADSEGGGNKGCFASKHDGANGRWIWQFDESHTNAFLFFKDYQTQNLQMSSGNNAVTLNTWQHILMTWDGSGTATNVKFYVNGTEVGSYQDAANGTGTKYSDAAQTFRIGNNASGTPAFNGEISEVAFWGVVLTAGQITQLANSRVKGMPLQIQPSNLQAYWPLDDRPLTDSINGDSFLDLSGNSNTGTGSDTGNQSVSTGEQVLSYPSEIQGH